MRRQPQKLRVYPNPWGVHPRTLLDEKGNLLPKPPVPHAFTLDHHARACGVVLEEVRSRVAPTVARFVGARIDEVNTRKLQKLRKGDDLRSERQETVYSFLGVSAHETAPFELAKGLAAKDALELTFSPYLVDRIRDGSLIAADPASAKAAQVRFVDPKGLLLALAKAAAAGFNAQFEDEEDVYGDLCGERKAASEAAKKADADAKAKAEPVATSSDDTSKPSPSKAGSKTS